MLQGGGWTSRDGLPTGRDDHLHGGRGQTDTSPTLQRAAIYSALYVVGSVWTYREDNRNGPLDGAESLTMLTRRQITMTE